MAAPNTTNVLRGIATIYTGTAGQSAATEVGYTRDGAVVNMGEESANDIDMDQADMPLFVDTMKLNGTVEFTVGEATLANMAFIQGVTNNGSDATFGPSATNAEISLRLDGTDASGTTRRWDIPYARCIGAIPYPMRKGEAQIIAMTFRVLNRTGSTPISITDGASTDATISSGVLTRTASQGFHKVRGEGGSADTLDSITGSGLTEGETLRLQLGNTNETITVTHGTNTLVLIDAADHGMANANDWMEFEYTTTDTKWVETGRYDHPVSTL